jgi:DNA-binding CsgD family transcriptional regulator
VTKAEFRVLALLSRSRRSAEIAVELGVAPSTVKTQLESMFARNHITHGRRELVARAFRDGFMIVQAGRAVPPAVLREVILATLGEPGSHPL